MIYEIFSIHDQATKTFMPGDYVKSAEEAIRKFKHNVNNEKMGFLYSNPEHFTLYRLGKYDDESGRYDSIEPQVVIKAVQVKATEQ